MKLLKNKSSKLILVTNRKFLIFILALMVAMVNMPVLTVKAISITFDYEGGTSGFDSNVVHQAKGGETLEAISSTYILTKYSDYGVGIPMGGSEALNIGVGGVESSVTFRLVSGSQFDLRAISFLNWTYDGKEVTKEKIIITTNKGQSIITPEIIDTPMQMDCSFYSQLSGITSFTITSVDSGIEGIAIDDIVLDNIKPLLSQVSNVQLSTSGIASWSDVNNEIGYDVKLYKNGVQQGATVQKASNVTSHNFLSDIRTLGPGAYSVEVIARGDGVNYVDGPSNQAFLNAGKLNKVTTGMTWAGDVAHWNTVANAQSYDVQLYKGGSLLGSAVNVLAANANNGVNFASAIASEGGDTYTYKVTAKADTNTVFFDADQSAASNNNVKAIQLSQVTNVQLSSTGVATWNNVANEAGFEVKLYKGGVLSTTVTPAADTLSYNFLSSMRGSGAGDYTVTVTAKGTGPTYSDGPVSAVSNIQTIVKLATVTDGLTWSGYTAHWTPVANAVSYNVELYKDGNSYITANVVAGDAANGVDFSSNIALGGGGNYTYKVTAKGDGTLRLDADESAFSNGKLVATPLSQVTGVNLSASGVASWNDVSNETGYEVQLYKGGNLQGSAVPKAANVLTHDFLADMRAEGIGVYTVKVTAKGDGTTYSDGLQSLASTSQTITKLATVNAGLTWTGDTAHWTSVSNAVSYDVQLYKGGNLLGSPVNVLAANVASGVDFGLAISSEGGGTYTYKVTAKADTSTLFLDADQSAASDNNIKAIQLPQVTNVVLSSTGIATWDNVANESGYEVYLYKDGILQGTAVTKAADVLSHDFLGDMRAGVGVYTVKVKAKGNGSTYSDGPMSSFSNGQSIVKLGTVTDGLTWTGNTAHWTVVPNAASYDVQLYKDGNPTIYPPSTVLAADVASGADFSITISLLGGGNYTYKVTAKADTSSLFIDADQSAFSNGNLVATPLSQVTGVSLSASGVASWNDVNNEIGYEVQLYKDGSLQGTAVPKSANELNHNFLADMRATGPGAYTVKVIAKGDGKNYSDGLQSLASASQTIAKLTTVNAGLTWSGDTAHWTAVPGAVSYDVQLYKNGTSLGTPVNILGGGVASGADFTSVIAAEGGGTYTYKVTAKADTSSLFIDADQSAASNDNTKAIQLAQVTNVALSSTGVATWDNVADESSFEVQLYKDGSAQGAVVTKAADTLSHDFLGDMRTAGAGVYTVKVTAKGNGSTYTDGVQSVASNSETIVQLATVVDGLTWSGNVAHWTMVPSAVSYDVQLYKDGNPLNAPVNILTGNVASGVDFSSTITGNGGTYIYKVTAKGDGILLLDGVQSAASNGKFIATPLPQVTNVNLSASGVASWDNLSNETNFEVQLYKDGNPEGTVITKAADVLNHDFLGVMRSVGTGVYTVKVTAKGNGNTYSDGPQSESSNSQTIEKLAAVTDGLNWVGDVAHWNTVPNASSYDVQLYKNGTSLGTPVNILAGGAASGADFTSVIAAEDGGTYSYKVTAKADLSSLFLDADQSAASKDNTKAIKLAQVTNVALSSTGVATWDNVANENSFEVQLYKDGNIQGTAVTKAADTLSHDFLGDMRAAGLGVYTVKVTAKGNGSTYTDGTQSAASNSETIVLLATVADGLTWSGNVAHWTMVPSAVSYAVQLYKDGNPLNAPVNILTANAASGVDFSSAITAGGIGTYTYKVTAKGDEILLLDAIQSAVSNDNIKVLSNDATLKDLSISSGAFNESFVPGVTAYTASVVNGVTSVTVTPVVNESHTTVKVAGKTVISGQASDAISLIVGANPISVLVTAQNGVTKTYVITVTREAIQSTPISNLTAIPGDRKVDLNFDAPAGASNVEVEQSIDGTNYMTTTSSAITATSTSAEVTDLNNGQEYSFRLVVTGGLHEGVSNVAIATPRATTPSAIAIDDLTAIPEDREVTLRFSAPIGATSVIVQQSIDEVNYVTATTTSAITVTSTSTKVIGLTNGTQYKFRLIVIGGMRAGISNVAAATPVSLKPEKPDDNEEERPTKPSNPSTPNPSGGEDTSKIGDIIKEIVKIEVNGKTTNVNGINQEKIVTEVKTAIKQSLDDIEVKALEKDLNSLEGAVQIKVSGVLADIGREINNIINKNIGYTDVSKNNVAKYEVKMSVVEEATNQKVYEKIGVTAGTDGITVENLKDFTSYIVKFDVVVDGKVVATREKKIMTLDRTPPVIHDFEVKDGVLKVNATDNFKLNDKPYMLIVAE